MIKGNITFDNADAFTAMMRTIIRVLKDDNRIICEEVGAYADHASNGNKTWLSLVINAICTFPELGDHPDYPGETWRLSIFLERDRCEVHTFLHQHDNVGNDCWATNDVYDIVDTAIRSARETIHEHE